MNESRHFKARMREAGCGRKQIDAMMSNLKRAKTDDKRWSVMRQIEAIIEPKRASPGGQGRDVPR